MQDNKSTIALILSTLAMTASFMVWNVLSPMAGRLQELFQLTAIEKSLLIAAPVLLGSIFRIPMGIYTDRYGGRKMFTGTMLFLTLPLLLAIYADNFALLMLSAILIGMAGTTFAISLTYVSRWYPPEKQGFVLGLAGIGNLGVAAASFLVPFWVDNYSVSSVFGALAVMIVIVATVYWFGTTDLPAPRERKSLKQSMTVLKYSSTWLLSCFYFLTFGGFVSFSVYLPTFLKELFQLTATDAGMKTAGFVVLATLIRPVGGYLADRYGSKKVLIVVFIGIMASALLLASVLHNFMLFTVGCLITSVMLGLGNGAVFKLVPEVSAGNTGAVTGIVGAAGGVGGFFPPIILGFIQQMSGSYLLGFVLLALFACSCLGLQFGMKRFMKTEYEAVAKLETNSVSS